MDGGKEGGTGKSTRYVCVTNDRSNRNKGSAGQAETLLLLCLLLCLEHPWGWRRRWRVTAPQRANTWGQKTTWATQQRARWVGRHLIGS